MKNIFRNLLVFITAAALFVSCSTKSSIVGKWDAVGADMEAGAYLKTLEFFEDGTITVTWPGLDTAGKRSFVEEVGKYSFVEDDRSIKLELGSLAAALIGPVIMRVSISGSELSLTDAQGKLTKYNRVN